MVLSINNCLTIGEQEVVDYSGLVAYPCLRSCKIISGYSWCSCSSYSPAQKEPT